MKIVSFAAQKGGVTKSYSAVNCAAYAASKGLQVVLVDIDGEQGTATLYLDSVHENEPLENLTWTRFTEPEDPKKLRALRRLDADLVIIDTKAVLSSGEIDAVLEISDLVVVPCQPSDADVLSITKTVALKLEGQFPYAVLFTRVHHAVVNLAYQQSFRKKGITTFNAWICDRSAWKTGIIRGRVVSNLPEKESKAASEFEAVGEELLTMVDLTQIDLRTPVKSASKVKVS